MLWINYLFEFIVFIGFDLLIDLVVGYECWLNFNLNFVEWWILYCSCILGVFGLVDLVVFLDWVVLFELDYIYIVGNYYCL